MESTFATRSTRVLIAEEAGSVRQLLSDALRSLDFLDITVVATGKDVFNALEYDDCDWIIMPTFIHQPVTAFHSLKSICEVPRLHRVRVSLMIDKEDESYLSLAFHYGLLSWHTKSYFNDHIIGELTRLFQKMKSYNWFFPLVAADYFRGYMNATRQFDPLLEVEQSLIQLFPGSFPLLLKYGETQLRSGKIKEGLGTLQQACLIDERAKRVVDSITEKHVNVKINTSSPFPAQQNILGIETCVLVDPDTAVLSALKKLLAQAGVPQIETFDKGEEAWNWLCNNPEPGLILQEWRIPDLPGPILLQRTRQHGFINTPINMISSVIKPEESHLLREFGVTDVIAKPFAPQSFFKSLVWTLQQHVCPTEQNSLQQKIMRLLKNEQIVEAERLKATFMADPRIRASCKKAVEATFAYHYGKYRESRNLAIEALKLQGDSLCLLNLIGKCLLKLGDSTAAMKVFEKAHSISKMNIETLCHLAIAQNDSGKRDESEATLQRAKGLDSKSQLIGETECQIALLNEDVSKSRRLMEELSSVQNVISYMNNRAVSLTRSGRFDDGIKLYQRTIEALPPKLSDTKDLVLYNLGLAYAKYGELQSAKQHLVEIASRSESKVLRKAESLLKRVKVAIEDNSPLSFYEAEDIDCGLPSPQESMLVETVTDGAQRGLCLHGIYRLQQDEHAKWNDLFESQPKFRDKRNNPSALRMEGFNNGN